MQDESAGTPQPFGGLSGRLQQRRREREAAPPIIHSDDLPFASTGPTCNECGAANPEDAAACIVCGSDVAGALTYQLFGTTMPALEITLEPGQRVYAQTGCLGWMTDNVQMQTVMAGSPWALLGRSMSGMSALVSEFSVDNEPGLVALTVRVPGRIVPLKVCADRGYVLQNGSFLAAQRGVHVSPYFQQNLGAIFFGGEDYVLQSVRGAGLVFAAIDGEVAQYELELGRTLLVDPGSIAVFDSSVRFGLRRVQGISNVLFSQGMFLAELTGPGHVWLQTMPFARLAGTLAAHLDPKRS